MSRYMPLSSPLVCFVRIGYYYFNKNSTFTNDNVLTYEKKSCLSSFFSLSVVRSLRDILVFQPMQPKHRERVSTDFLFQRHRRLHAYCYLFFKFCLAMWKFLRISRHVQALFMHRLRLHVVCTRRRIQMHLGKFDPPERIRSCLFIPTVYKIFFFC